MVSSKRETGNEHEKSAADYLRSQGLKFLQANYHSRHGEIDLIMQDHDTLVFIEVRYRRNSAFGGAKISITPAKQRKIALTALQFLQRYKKTNRFCRFDVVAVNGEQSDGIEWVKEAFESPL